MSQKLLSKATQYLESLEDLDEGLSKVRDYLVLVNQIEYLEHMKKELEHDYILSLGVGLYLDMEKLDKMISEKKQEQTKGENNE